MAIPPDYSPLKRSLCILRLLARGPAGRHALAEYVAVVLDDSAYGGLSSKQERKTLENDLARLRALGVEYEYADGEYRLISYGDFDPVALGEDELNALAFLTEAFGPSAVNGEEVQALLRRIADWLPGFQRDSLAGRRQRWRIELGRTDSDVIVPQVQETIEQAIAQRRLLRFDYLSPGYRDGVARVHTVQPWHLLFDTALRHLYLEAYTVEIRSPHEVQREAHWVRYRLGRIIASTVTVLPDKFAPVPPKRRRYHLEYLLAPDIAGRGEVSRHFDDMQVHEADAAGWVRVTATTTDLFSALRKLLRYAHNCKVIGGAEARKEMEELVKNLAHNYGLDKTGGDLH
jgi:predicted DNA-binding transcriptional regulator YafY